MLAELFTTVIYQPFFNILVLFYYLLGLVTQGQPDMGIAVILLTILIRLLLLPLSLGEHKSEAERREIAAKLHDLEEVFADDPINFRKHKKLLLQSNRRVVVAELGMLVIQVLIALMLWRIFATGLEGEDIHLLYSFMPDVDLPFNLVFLGRYDLSHTNFLLNLVQSLCIFALETLSIYTSIYPPGKGEVVRLQLVLPIVSFFVFMFLPAGKKLFVITTLIFSIILKLFKYIRGRFEAYRIEHEQAEGEPTEEKIVVDVK